MTRFSCVYRKAFTLVEILIVIIIVGIIAGFGIPNFSKSIGRSKARDAINNLSIIHAANAIYKVRNNSNIPSGDLTIINGKLLLNIIAPSGTQYECGATDGVCTVTADNGDFVVTAYLNNPLGTSNPICTSTSSKCPH